MNQPRITAVLVNYNSGAELHDALQSFVDECGGMSWRAVVVDNASAEDCSAMVASFGPHVDLVRNDSNLGFGRAVNQALALVQGPLLLIMNPDCRLTDGALRSLETEIEHDGGCAIVGPRILNPDGSDQGSARGDPDMLTGLFGRTGLLRRMLPGAAVSRRNVPRHDPSSMNSVIVDWVSGACMLARSDALRKVGGFDERYFLYWEDADLCRRLRMLGHRIRYCPRAVAVHRVGQSSRTAQASSIRAFHRSAYLYYATHVAPRAGDPKRMLARGLLAARCWWRLKNLVY